MKAKIFFSTLALFLSFMVMYAQSDYNRTQNFKNQYKQIESSIRNAESLNDCNQIEETIARFRNDFIDSKALLDKALYPENFESSIEKIENMLAGRKKDFTQITNLTDQVDTLQAHVLVLNTQNEDLIRQISELNSKSLKNEAEISKLNKLVAQLRNNTMQRDLLVRDLVDSLLAAFVKSPSDMNKAEQQSIISKVNKSNLFYNVERTIDENIQFVKVTSLTPKDFSEMKEQYHQFKKVWNQIGPRLAVVYLNKKQNKSEISGIDSLFAAWDNQMNTEIWHSINKLFYEKGLILPPFNNGDQFLSSMNSLIDNEIKNFGIYSNEESEKTFKTFSDEVYFRSVQPDWMPLLLANNMISKENQTSLEDKIAVWKKTVTPSSNILIYILIGIILLSLIVFAAFKARKKAINAE